MKKPTLVKTMRNAGALLVILFAIACNSPSKKESTANQTEEETSSTNIPTETNTEPITDSTALESDTTDPDIVYDEVHEEPKDTVEHEYVELKPGDYDPTYFGDSLQMEALYMPMLQPIVSLKESDPKTYWFIVSWLNTAYKTPKWDGYDNYAEWQKRALKAGVDCSGFSRVMCDRVFGTKVAGSSRGIYANQCDKISREELQKGDLVFFRAPYSEPGSRIVHVGVYLFDDYFVHATSTRSASKGRGFMVSSLNEKNWAAELEGAGRVKTN